MIKFFRHIRKSILMENKTGKYFKYAIGEIILVVIGILIALEVNNLNEQRKIKAKEQAYLRELHIDFKTNKRDLETIFEYNKRSIHACQRVSILKEYFYPDNPKVDATNMHLADSLFYYSSHAFKNKSFNPKSGTVNAIINSSNIDVISNDSLRRCLIAWPDVLEDYLEEERYNWDFLFKEVGPWRRENYNMSNPQDPENLKTFFSKQEQNYFSARKSALLNTITAVEEEGIFDIINTIIALTQPKTND